MSFALGLQIAGFIFTVLAAVCFLWSAFISEKGENIFNYFHQTIIQQPRELYSEMQTIVWPSPDGEHLSLSLDGLGLVHAWGEADSNSIAMATNVVPQTSPGVRVPGQYETRQVRVLEAVEGSKKYYFNTSNQQAHELHVADRKFIVKLVEVKKVTEENPETGERKETFMNEYIFQITEIE